MIVSGMWGIFSCPRYKSVIIKVKKCPTSVHKVGGSDKFCSQCGSPVVETSEQRFITATMYHTLPSVVRKFCHENDISIFPVNGYDIITSGYLSRNQEALFDSSTEYFCMLFDSYNISDPYDYDDSFIIKKSEITSKQLPIDKREQLYEMFRGDSGGGILIDVVHLTCYVTE